MHVQEVFQLMAALSRDNRFEEACQGERRETNMCEFLDRVETRGVIKGTIATCRRFGLATVQILKEIMQQYHLEEQEAWKYLDEAGFGKVG